MQQSLSGPGAQATQHSFSLINDHNMVFEISVPTGAALAIQTGGSHGGDEASRLQGNECESCCCTTCVQKPSHLLEPLLCYQYARNTNPYLTLPALSGWLKGRDDTGHMVPPVLQQSESSLPERTPHGHAEISVSITLAAPICLTVTESQILGFNTTVTFQSPKKGCAKLVRDEAFHFLRMRGQ